MRRISHSGSSPVSNKDQYHSSEGKKVMDMGGLNAYRIGKERFVDDITITRSGDGEIHLKGELSYNNVSALYRQTIDLFKEEKDLRIDFSGVTRSDSAGVALLVEWLSEARDRNQPIQFINIPDQMLDVVRVSSLERVLPIS